MAKKSHEIKLYGNIGNDWYGGGLNAKFIENAINEAKRLQCEILNVRINSPGGSVFEGVAMYNLLAQSGLEVNTFIDGIAYSMGGIIAIAGKKVHMAKNATLLIHNASGGAWGNSRDLQSAVELLSAIDEGLAITIADKVNMSSEEVKAKWFDFADHTFTAQQAKDAGLVDSILEKDGSVPKNLATMNQTDLFNFYAKFESDAGNNEDSIINKLANKISGILNLTPPVIEEEEEITNDLNKETMKITNNMTAIVAALGIAFAQGETEVVVEPTVENLQKLNDALAQLTTDKTTAENNLTEANNKATEWENKYTDLANTDAGTPPKNLGGADAQEEQPVDSVTAEALKLVPKK